MPKLRIKRLYYRNGQIHVEQREVGGQLHGLVRIWHANGRMASEERYRHGLLDGQCRQWDDRGRLLGSYRMLDGTGIHRGWFEDGGLQTEFSTVNGKWTGRHRHWLRDGALAGETWLIENRDVTRAQYAKAAAKHPDWPRYSGERTQRRPLTQRQFDTRTYALHCRWLLSKRSNREALLWLEEGTSETRSLGRLGHRRAKSLLTALAVQGVKHVLAIDIYHSKAGKQFCDRLLVQVPKLKPQRLAIRRIFKKLPRQARCGVQPAPHEPHDWLYVYFG